MLLLLVPSSVAMSVRVLLRVRYCSQSQSRSTGNGGRASAALRRGIPYSSRRAMMVRLPAPSLRPSSRGATFWVM